MCLYHVGIVGFNLIQSLINRIQNGWPYHPLIYHWTVGFRTQQHAILFTSLCSVHECHFGSRARGQLPALQAMGEDSGAGSGKVNWGSSRCFMVTSLHCFAWRPSRCHFMSFPEVHLPLTSCFSSVERRNGPTRAKKRFIGGQRSQSRFVWSYVPGSVAPWKAHARAKHQRGCTWCAWRWLKIYGGK
jgi:hypothetical protein